MRLSSLLLLVQGAAGCSDKGVATTIDPVVSQLLGTWTWVRSFGGFAPHVMTPPAGSTVKDSYSVNGSFSRKRNDTLIVSAKYSISRENSFPLMKLTEVKTYAGYQFYPFDEWVQVEGDTLRLSDNGADLFQHTFARSKP